MFLEDNKIEKLLLSIGVDMEDIIDKKSYLDEIGIHKIEAIIQILKKYHCHNVFIKECLLYRNKIVMYDIEQLAYILESIVSNGDMVEDVLLEIL